MISTFLSALGALIAAYAAMKATKSWKAQSRFDSRREAVNAWVGGAMTFRGRLKFIYKDNVKWPDDKKEIEYISENFWNWASKWPSAKANLDGELRAEAEKLWLNIFDTYNPVMDGHGNLKDLYAAVEKIYNSEILEKALSAKS